jgi:hypothetical protein
MVFFVRYKKSGSLVPKIQTCLVVALRWSWVANTNRLCPNISQVQQMFPQKMVHTTYMFMYIYIYVYVYMYIYISYTKNGTSSMTTYFVICLNLHVPVPSTTSTSSTWLRFSLPVARWAWKTMGKVPEFHSLCCPMFRESRKTGEGHWGTALQPLIRKAKIHTLGFWVSFQALEWSISVIWNYADSIVDLGRIRISDKQLELRDTPIMEKNTIQFSRYNRV